MSYSHNQRKKNIKKFLNSALSCVKINEVNYIFSKVNNVWKLKDYIEPVTSSK